MSDAVLARETNRRQLQQIIAVLSDGVILLEVDQSIIWANEAALRNHDVDSLEQLGCTNRSGADAPIQPCMGPANWP